MQATGTEAAMPAPYRHSFALYDLLDKEAEVMLVEGQLVRVWSGHMTKMVTDGLGLSLPYYTKILTLLKASNCLQQLQRGAVLTPSKWILLQTPTLELFDAVSKNSPLQTTSRLRTQANDQKMKDINTRVNELEDKVTILIARVEKLLSA